MANKKDFGSNPALQFITESTESSKPKSNKKVKKETLEDRLEEIRALLPEGKHIEVRTEPRSQRLQLVITPTMKRQMREAAEQQGISINEFVVRAIDEKIERDFEE